MLNRPTEWSWTAESKKNTDGSPTVAETVAQIK